MKEQPTTRTTTDRGELYTFLHKGNEVYIRKANPFKVDKAPEFGSTEWSRFESKAIREAIPFNKSENTQIVEAYEKDGVLAYDPERPYHAANMSFKAIEAVYVTQPQPDQPSQQPSRMPDELSKEYDQITEYYPEPSQQEGETVGIFEQFAIDNCTQVVPNNLNGLTTEQVAFINNEKRLSYVKGCQKFAQWQSQQTATALEEKDKRIAELEEKAKKVNWVNVCDLMPPFDKLILLRGVVSWKSKNSVSYFSDIVKNDYEILEYGLSGYLLQDNNDFLVINHHSPNEVCDEYITHWSYINEPI